MTPGRDGCGAGAWRRWPFVGAIAVCLGLALADCALEPVPLPYVQLTCGDGTTEVVADQDMDGVPDEAACDWNPDQVDCDPGDPAVGYPVSGYPDEDRDGYTLFEMETACPGAVHVEDSPSAEIDCDDAEPRIHPGADETCDDGIDQDCSGSDLACTDVDDDGDGYTEGQGDCDDTNPDVNPGAQERCNEIDDDCDGAVDEGVLTTYYKDRDGDGYGTSAFSESCEPSHPYTASQPGDCDDGNPNISPGAVEVCNDVDDDCDGSVDEGFDKDGDGYTSCGGDCDDENPNISPGAQEVCNQVDDDCDSLVDDGVGTPYYLDADKDGYGDPDHVKVACSRPVGYSSVGFDCDDTDSTIYPGAFEVCGDGIDQDCDGSDLSCSEVDNDGDGYSENEGDCDDSNIAVYPGAAEACNLRDDDCDGDIDEEFSKLTFYQDADGDGYGDPNHPVEACKLPSQGYVVDSGDCDDSDPTIHPNAEDPCGDGTDQDCSGADCVSTPALTPLSTPALTPSPTPRATPTPGPTPTPVTS